MNDVNQNRWDDAVKLRETYIKMLEALEMVIFVGDKNKTLDIDTELNTKMWDMVNESIDEAKKIKLTDFYRNL